MVINDIERFVYIHIPKNAGNSITRLLLKHFGNDDSRPMYHPLHSSPKWKEGLPFKQRPGVIHDQYTGRPYLLIPQHAGLKWVGNNLPEVLLYKKICFSRNPYSRMVSWWTYNRSHEKFWEEYDLARHARDMEFNEWLLKCIQRGRQELIPQVYFISPYYKFELPQLEREVLEARIGDSMKPGDPPTKTISTEVIRMDDSTIDVHPLRHNNFIRGKFGLGETDNPTPIYQPNADFVGKVENLEQDIKRLFDYLGVKDNVMDVTQENPSKEKVDYREQYNTESVEIVQSIFQQDFEYFNYSYNIMLSI